MKASNNLTQAIFQAVSRQTVFLTPVKLIQNYDKRHALKCGYSRVTLPVLTYNSLVLEDNSESQASYFCLTQKDNWVEILHNICETRMTRQLLLEKRTHKAIHWPPQPIRGCKRGRLVHLPTVNSTAHVANAKVINIRMPL